MVTICNKKKIAFDTFCQKGVKASKGLGKILKLLLMTPLDMLLTQPVKKKKQRNNNNIYMYTYTF